MIKPGVRSLDCRVSATPVGEDESFESEILLKHIGEQIAVLACELAIHAIVGAHDGAGIRDAEGDLEGAQIGFAHGPFADVCIERIAAALLVVYSVMLQIADNVFGLDAAHEVALPSYRRAVDLRPGIRMCVHRAVRESN